MTGGRFLDAAPEVYERRRGPDTQDISKRCPGSEAPKAYEKCRGPDSQDICDRCPDSKVHKSWLDTDRTDILEWFLGPDLPNIFERDTYSEIPDICGRCPQSKVSNNCERCHGPEPPKGHGRCPNYLGTRKRYPGHDVLGRHLLLEAKIEAT